MGTRVRIELNGKGARALLQHDNVRRDLERRARNIDAAAGGGHTVDSRIGATRARASVRADTPETMAREAKRRALTRAIDAGRS